MEDKGKSPNYTANEISILGETSEEGDAVICYRTGGSNMNFAFKGRHEKTEGNKILVKYDDGETHEEEKTLVHKLVTLHSIQEGNLQLHFTKIIMKWVLVWHFLFFSCLLIS